MKLKKSIALTRMICLGMFTIALTLTETLVGQAPTKSPAAAAPPASAAESPSEQSSDQELDSKYLKKWTPIRRTDSRFPYEDETDDDWIDDRFEKMNTGPTFCGSIKTPGKGMTPKGIAIRLCDDDGNLANAAILFDTQGLNIRAAWTGDFLDLPPKRFGMLAMPSIKGQLEYSSQWDGGWSLQGKNGQTESLNPSTCRFEKYTLSGNRVELAYVVNHTSITEQNAQLSLEDSPVVFRRLIQTQKNDRELSLSLVSVTADSFRMNKGANGQSAVITRGDDCWLIRLGGTGTSLRHSVTQKNTHHVSVVFPKSDSRQIADLAITHCQTSSVDELIEQLSPPPPLAPIADHPPRWGKPIETVGKCSSKSKPLVVDEITVPYENRFNALMYTSGFDFLPDGTAMVCTMHGDVWSVQGIDKELKNITWRRFATGLYQPLGLKIVEGVVHVLGRDRITVLKDLNGDGEADEYYNFCDLLQVTGQPHAYAMSLETDSNGNFYFIKSGGSPPHGGTMIKVSPDGTEMSVVATGYRHANGIGVGPNDEITSADNEGNWMPTTRIDLVRQNGFYGHMPTHRRETPPETYDPPLCWVPRLIDNSAGGQVWVNSDSWGPLNGKMLHLSFGRCTANLVLPENVNGTSQAGILKLDLPTFLSGSMRGRFNPRDGHLYLVGLDGWQTAAVKDGCFQRVRATGKPIHLPVDLHIKNSRVEITFSQPVDKQEAKKLANWNVQQWNYRWTKEYGSDHYRVSNPDEVGHDEIPILNIQVSRDGRTVTLELSDLKPVMQMQITGNIKSSKGIGMPVQIFNTVHTVGN